MPEDVRAVAVPVLEHRLIVAPEARAAGVSGAEAVEEALDETPVPVMSRGGALLLGAGVTVSALAFGSRPLGVAGVGLLLAAVAARIWAGLARAGVSVSSRLRACARARG